MAVAGVGAAQTLYAQQMMHASLMGMDRSSGSFADFFSAAQGGVSSPNALNSASLSSGWFGGGQYTTSPYAGLSGGGSYNSGWYSPMLSGEQNTSGLMMAAMLGQNTSGSSALMMSLRNAMMSSPGMTVALKSLFSPMGSKTGAIDHSAGDTIPSSPGRAVNPALTSDMSTRSPLLYSQVVNQFRVETNPRYAIRDGSTYCNIFMWDVTRAMGAEIPHYYDRATGQPRYYPDTKGANEMNANAIYDWLHRHGGTYGWFEVSPQQAQTMANQGRPAVTAWRNNSGGHGHVQVVVPSKDGAYSPERGVMIAQAGRRLTSYRPITEIYNASLPKVKYFAHM